MTIFTARWTIGFCCGFSTGLDGGYGADAEASDTDLEVAFQKAKTLAHKKLADREAELSETEEGQIVLDNAVCVLDDGSAEDPESDHQYFFTHDGREATRHERPKKVVEELRFVDSIAAKDTE